MERSRVHANQPAPVHMLDSRLPIRKLDSTSPQCPSIVILNAAHLPIVILNAARLPTVILNAAHLPTVILNAAQRSEESEIFAFKLAYSQANILDSSLRSE